MSYLDEAVLTEITNILNDLEVEDNIQSFKSQIEADDEYSTAPINILKPLLAKYQRAMKIEGADEDDLAEVSRRMRSISFYIINAISEKYRIDLNENWIGTNENKISAFAAILYQFFILDYFHINMEILSNYIRKNKTEILETFKDIPAANDVTTKSNIKNFDPNTAILINHIYDITDYIFTLLDTENIFDYLKKDYVPGIVLSKMYNELHISGDFVNIMSHIYKENIDLRSKITFEIIFSITNGLKEFTASN